MKGCASFSLHGNGERGALMEVEVASFTLTFRHGRLAAAVRGANQLIRGIKCVAQGRFHRSGRPSDRWTRGQAAPDSSLISSTLLIPLFVLDLTRKQKHIL